MSMNADPNASFSLSTWILKSPTIRTLSAASTNSDRKISKFFNKVCMVPWWPVYSSQYKRHGGFIINTLCDVNQFCIIVFFAAVKPANNILFCIELIQRPESSLRRHKLGCQDQSIRSNDDKTRFTCVHKQQDIPKTYAEKCLMM